MKDAAVRNGDGVVIDCKSDNDTSEIGHTLNM